MAQGSRHIRLQSRVVRFVLCHRAITLLAFLAATGFLCFELRHLEMAEDPLQSMYPDGHPFLPVLESIRKMAPEARMVVSILEVKSGDIYNAETIQKVHSITKGLMSIDGGLPGGITSLTRGFNHYAHREEGLSIEPILGRKWPEKPEEFEALRRKVAVNPMGPGRYVSYDGTATMITAVLGDLDERAQSSYRKLSDEEKARLPFEQHKQQETGAFQARLLRSLEEIKAREDDSRHTLHFMGEDVITAQMTEMGARHVPLAAAGTFALTLVLLAAYSRSLRGTFVPLAGLALSCLWNMGLFAWAGSPFHPMALVFPLVLAVFSLILTALAVQEYEQAYVEKRDKSLALAAAYGNAPIGASILAAGLAMAGLWVTKVPMIRDFGLLGLLWMLSTFVVVIVATPILLSLLPAPGTPAHRDPLAGLAGWAPDRSRPWLVAILVILLASGVLCAARLEVGDNVPGSSYIRPDHPWNQCFHLLSRKFMGPFQLLVHARAAEEGGLLDPEAMRSLAEFSGYLKDACGARDSIAFDMMVRMARLMLTDGNPKWQTLPDSREEIEGLARLVVEQGGVESFMDKTFTEATISPFFPTEETEQIDLYASRMQATIDAHPSGRVEFGLGGGLLAMTKLVNDGTRDSYWKSLAAAFAVVSLLGVILTGSLRASAIVTLPVAAAQSLLWCLLAASGMPLSLPVASVAAFGVGSGSLFGFILVRKIADASGEAGGSEAAVEAGWADGAAQVLFVGVLAFAACLPWFFIGLKFQSNMVLVLGVLWILEAFAALLFVPVLVSWLRPKL